jgi:hypothetical protein
MSTLHILDSTGDSTFTWDASPELVADVESAFDNAALEDVARAKFTKMLALGYRAHMTKSADDTGNDATITRNWDEARTAAAVIMVPQTVGG